jgi:AcrR family transcriptional regulator
MAPDERRAAIVAATLPLLREHGQSVSTRQIAQAAGVAEGTIFGVFPDKSSLIQAALISAFDPEPFERAVAKIEPTAGLRDRLKAVSRILVRDMTDKAPLLAMARTAGAPPDPHHGFFAQLGQARARRVTAVASVIEPDRSKLRHSPDTAARLMLMLVAVAARDLFGAPLAGSDAIDSDEIVTLLLDGLLRRPADRHDTGDGDEIVTLLLDGLPRRPADRHDTGDSM